ncbi:MAG TPA: glycosyltransferase family 4 protein [Gemmatales bacterium]|nr:glycosyltransferase family 4 protein [Gemmatales bacterium]
MSRPRIYLAALGDVNDPRTWSGIPYHFLQAAQAGNLIDEGLTLVPDGADWRRRRILWNSWRYFTGQGKGGFQYSTTALERLWVPKHEHVLDQVVINCFQLFPPSIVAEHRIHKQFYIDMTLTQLFDFYQERCTIGSRIAQEAVQREKEGYQSATFVVCHSQWAARSVLKDYGIEAGKVKVIVPGANLDLTSYRQWQQDSTMPVRPSGKSLQLIFIGKQWHRKGLDRLLEALQLVEQQGQRVNLSVLGCYREELPSRLQNIANVQWLGFVDKRKEMQRFFDLVAEADVGCLLSRAEAGGMVLREYHALGLVVLGTAVGGAPEHMFSDAGYAVPPDAPPEAIAGWLLELVDHPEKLAALRRRAWERKEEATWDGTVAQWRALLS